MLLPDPLTPETHVSVPSGIRASTPLRLCSAALRITIHPGVLGRRLTWPARSPILLPEVRSRDRPGRGGQLLGPAARHDVSAIRPGAGAKIKNPVGRANHGLVVLDDDHAVPLSLKPAECGDELIGIAGMEPGRGLVEHIADAHQPGADLRGQPRPLQLSAGECIGPARQGQVTQANLLKESRAAR